MAGRKSFKQLFEAPKVPQVEQQPVVVAFFRFNPPALGHGELVQQVLDLAEEADHMIFLSQSVDPETNPLDCETKNEFLKTYFPHVNFICDETIQDVHSMLEFVNSKGYKDVVLVADPDKADQNKQFANLVGNDNLFQFEAFRVEPGVNSDDDPSTKLRQLAKASKFKQFVQNTPNPQLLEVGKAMFDAVRGGMKLK